MIDLTWVNGLYVRVYDWARRWKRLAKVSPVLARSEDERLLVAMTELLAAMTERAERAEARYIGSEKDLDAKHAKLVEAESERDAARAELAAMTEWKERERLRAEHGLESSRERDAARAEVERLRGELHDGVVGLFLTLQQPGARDDGWRNIERIASTMRAALKGEGE